MQRTVPELPIHQESNPQSTKITLRREGKKKGWFVSEMEKSIYKAEHYKAEHYKAEHSKETHENSLPCKVFVKWGASFKRVSMKASSTFRALLRWSSCNTLNFASNDGISFASFPSSSHFMYNVWYDKNNNNDSEIGVIVTHGWGKLWSIVPWQYWHRLGR